MTFQVTIAPSGRQFNCDSEDTVLTAATQAGINLPYGCKNGACGSCKGKVLQGKVTHKVHQQQALSDKEEAMGFALFCCAIPTSDIQIEAREVQGANEVSVKKMPVRVSLLERVSDDVMIITLQLPTNQRLQYLAGQYIEFILQDGRRRSYSLANAPHHDDKLVIHVRHMPGGVFTDHVFNKLKERDILRTEGPHGTFFLREESTKPIILLASGTGFAPIKAIVEHAIHIGLDRQMTLYWGGRRPHDLYMHNLCLEWGNTLANFKYVPVISDATLDDAWQGRTGFVHLAVVEDHPDLSEHEVYACGAPIMVDSAKRDFALLCKLTSDAFYADAFISEADFVQQASVVNDADVTK